MINDKTLIAVLAAIHLLSAVGLASFDQDRMMYATLRAVFENIFVNGEIHDKESRDHVLDLINLERLKQLKSFGSRFSTDSIETDVSDIYGTSYIQLQCSPYCDIIYVIIYKSPNCWLSLYFHQ